MPRAVLWLVCKYHLWLSHPTIFTVPCNYLTHRLPAILFVYYSHLKTSMILANRAIDKRQGTTTWNERRIMDETCALLKNYCSCLRATRRRRIPLRKKTFSLSLLYLVLAYKCPEASLNTPRRFHDKALGIDTELYLRRGFDYLRLTW